jgi:Zn-finger protein
LIIGENYTIADAKYRKANCQSCKNIYTKNLVKTFGYKQRIRHKIAVSLSEHKMRGYLVLGTLDEFESTFTGECAFCGIKFDIFCKDRHKRGSMDRKSNGKTVSCDDIQWLCHKCNLIKQDMSNEAFLDYINKIRPNLEKLAKKAE